MALTALTCAISFSNATPLRPVAGNPFNARLLSLLQASTDLGARPAGETAALTLGLDDPTTAARQASIDAMYTPGSPTYGRTLTPAELAAQIGPDLAAVGRVIAQLRTRGLVATWTQGNPWLGVEGPVARINATFGTAVHDYRDPKGLRFYASPVEPTIPAFLRPVVNGAGHVSSYPTSHTSAIPAGGLKPLDTAIAYDTKPLRDAGYDGSGETIVFWEVADGWKQADLDAFNQKFGLPAVKPELKGGGPANSPQEGELIMDLESAHAIAPGAHLVVYTNQWNSDAQFFGIEDKYVTENPGAIISLSWGGCELDSTKTQLQAEAATYAKADQLGETVLVSTGDSGAYTCATQKWGAPPSQDLLGVSRPAIMPGVTAVGGTTISVGVDLAWHKEVVWEGPSALAGTGGGFSTFFPIPAYQKAPGVQNQFNTSRRSIPDISADADPASGMAIISNGRQQQGGGTSLSTPMWAGFTALMNQYLKRNGGKAVGFLNPTLYAIASGQQTYLAYHDVTSGTNLAYPATPGYDLATGLGTPDVWNLVRDIAEYQKR